MRIIFILLAILCIPKIQAQSEIKFPEDFKLDNSLLSGAYLQEVNETLLMMGITDNPGVLNDISMCQRLSDLESDEIVEVYFELYRSNEDDTDDAGVIVTEFTSEDALKQNLYQLRAQSNLAYLIKGNYLIKVWSDFSKNSEKHISDMVEYYKNKLRTEEYVAIEDESIEEVATEAVEEAEAIEVDIQE